MSNELTAALIVLAISILAALGAIIRWIPDAVKRNVEAKEQERQHELSLEREEREARITELKSRVEETDKLVSQIARGNDLNERLINNIVLIAQEQSTTNKIVSAHTTAITGNTEALGLVNKSLDAVDKRLDTLEKGVAQINATITGLPNCETYTKDLADMEVRIMDAIKQQAKRETIEANAANIMTDDVLPKAS